jgi:hypothetical protein
MVVDRDEHNEADPNNPLTSVRHVVQHGSDTCLGLMVWIWCPGCQALHAPKFRCPEHGGPESGPIWNGDPYSLPFSMEPSLLIYETPVSPKCHSFVRRGKWQFLPDCTHALAGRTVPMEPLPDWLVREFEED